MEFHTYLSDGKHQDSAVVNDHMERLIVFLMKEHIMKEDGVIMCTSDGAPSKYICATAYYFLSTLAYKYNITIDRFISAPGHGKGTVDGINGSKKGNLQLHQAGN